MRFGEKGKGRTFFCDTHSGDLPSFWKPRRGSAGGKKGVGESNGG